MRLPKAKAWFLAAFLITVPTPLVIVAQNGVGNEVLTNDRVVMRVKAGLPPSLVVSKIRESQTNFNTNTSELIGLQKNKAGTQKQDTAMKFFYIVNQSRFEVEVRVLADKKELFVQRMKAKKDDSPGITHPSNGKDTTLELKVPMNKQAKQLTVQESSHLKKCKTFDITEAGKEGAGFQVIIGKDRIILIQDYYPAR